MKIIHEPSYVCDICGSSYKEKEKAQSCEEHGKFLQSKKTLPINCWYLIRRTQNATDDRLCFIYKTREISMYSCCIDNYVELHDAEYDTYYILGRYTWKLIKTFSIQEVYDKYKILPKINFRVKHKYKYDNEDIKKIREDIVKSKLDELVKLDISDIDKNYPELASYLLEEEYDENKRILIEE